MKVFLMLSICMSFHASLQAQTWTGSSGSDWFTAGNWNPATVPGTTSAVLIPGSLSTYPTLTADVAIAGITMQSGSILHLAGYTFIDSGNVSLSTATVDGGGAFIVRNAGSVSISASTMTTALTVTNYTGTCGIYDNTITGNTIIKDSSAQNSSLNYIDGNSITGNLSLTHASATDEMTEGYGSPSGNGNYITGNAIITLSGAGQFHGAYNHALKVDGNLTINRTSASGNTYINGGNVCRVDVGGTFSVSSSSTGAFALQKVKNGTTGGTVSVSGASNLDVRYDTLKATVNIAAYTGSAGIYDNSFTGAVTLSDASSQNSSFNYIDGNLITGNYNLTHASATNEMVDGYGSPSGNGTHVTGNAVITLSGAGQFQAAYNHALKVDGNLTINRTSSTGNTYINGGNGTRVDIGGTFSVSSASTGAFALVKVKNGTAGGTVSISDASNLDVRYDTLKATVNITAYTGSAGIYDNSFTGAVTLSDASSQNSSFNYIDGNLITGNYNLTHASATNEMVDGYGSPSGNGTHVTGNAVITLSGAGQFQAAYNHALKVDGNLTINRTSSTGNTYINGGNGTRVDIGGTFSVSSASTGAFALQKVKNGTTGGTVSVSGASNLDVRYDTLKATVNITAYTGSAGIYDNSFTGAVTLSDASSQNSSFNYIDGNLITGNYNLTHASATNEMVDGYGSPSGNGNHVTGNAVITLSGAGQFQAAYNHALKVDGNLTINRTSATGNTYINGGNGTRVDIGGTFSVSSASTGAFALVNIKNGTAGGTVSISDASGLDIRYDTLKATVNITAYTGTLNFLDNLINGNTLIADANTQSSGTNYFDGNRFAGNFTLVHSSATGTVYDGYGSPSGNGNVVTGKDSIVNLSGAAAIIISNTHTHQADGDFVLNAPSGVNILSIIFGGSTLGKLRVAGAQPVSVPNVFLNKSGTSLELQTTLSVTNTLSFVAGTIVATSPLVFADGATHTGAGNSSHVLGTVYKAGSQAFTFPLGFSGVYSPAGISAPSSTTDTFNATYIRNNPHPTYDSGQHDASIHHVSRTEYWLINRVSGSSNVKVTLGFNSSSSGGINNISQLTVAHWSGSPASWKDEGNGGTTGSASMGTVTSNNTITTFSPFTIASTTANNIISPSASLPVRLISFQAQKAGTRALLTWRTAEEKGIEGYEVERSNDARTFLPIGRMKAENNSNGAAYELHDEQPLHGTNYYRVAISETDGSRDWSEVRALQFRKDENNISLYPNPASEVLHIRNLAVWCGAMLTARNMSGQLLHKVLLSGTEQEDIAVATWPSGIYQIEISDGSQSVLQRFIRE